MFLDTSAPRSLFFVCNPKAPDCIRVVRRPDRRIGVAAFASQGAALAWAIANEPASAEGVVLLNEVPEPEVLGWLASLRASGVAGLWIIDEDRWIDLPDAAA